MGYVGNRRGDGWMGERARGARLGLASLGEVRRSLIGWVVGIA